MDTPNRRRDDAMNVQMLAMMQSLHEKLDAHTDEEMAKWAQIETKLDGVIIAFPDGDTLSHKLYHEKRIEDEARQQDFVNNLKKEVGKWGVISILAFIFTSIWYYITHINIAK